MGENERFMQIGFADTFSDITPDFCGRMKAERIASTIQCYIGDKRNIGLLHLINAGRLPSGLITRLTVREYLQLY